MSDSIFSETMAEITSAIKTLPKERQLLFLETLGTIAATAKAAANRKTLAPPVRDLTQKELTLLKAVARRYLWSKISPIDERNAFEWIRDYYSSFMPGLLQGQLRKVDFELWSSFRTLVARHGSPPWLDLPTAKENDDRTAAFSDLAQDARELSKALSTHASRVRRQIALRL